MPRSPRIRSLFAACALLLLTSGVADAQWILLGRKVVGRVENMVQQPDASQPSSPRYDVAVVVLETPAAKVYDTVIATIAKHPDYRYAQRNENTRGN